MPNVFPAEGKSEGLQTHGFVGHVAGQDDQVGPADLVAVFFLDRPQEATGLVQAGIVGPGIKGCETLIARAGTAAAICDAV